MSDTITLSRSLGLVSATCLVAGSVIGSGVFLVASDISRALPAGGAALSVWLAAGLLSLLGALSFAELGAMYPGAGGQYLYLREAFGPTLAFLFGWTQFLVVQAGSIAAVAISFAKFASLLFPLSPFEIQIMACAAIAALTGVNLLGVRKGAGLLDTLTGIKALALLVLACAGFLLSAPALPPAPSATLSVPAYGVALIAALWAYDGWNNVTFVSGEIREPRRNVPLALGLGLGLVTLLYLGVNAAYYRLLGPASVGASSFVAADAARVLGGNGTARLVALLVLLSTLGCANGMILAGPRVLYAMAQDGGLPRAVAYVHPRFRVPTVALFVQMLWSALLVFSGRYDQLFTYVVCAAFIFYGLSGAALILLRRRRPEMERPYRVPGYPWTPLLYVAFTLAFTLNAFREKPAESLVGLGIVLLGLPASRWLRGSRAPAGEPEF